MSAVYETLPSGKRTATITVVELEFFWNHTRDEWGFLGPVTMDDDEEIRFIETEAYSDEYHVQRWIDGEWETVSDETYTDRQVGELRRDPNEEMIDE